MFWTHQSNSNLYVMGILALSAVLTINTPLVAQNDPLPSWNDGPTKQAIMTFMAKTTDPNSPQFVPPAQRIVTFDQDGTLWVEHPMYSQVVYCFSRVPAVVKAKPELAVDRTLYASIPNRLTEFRRSRSLVPRPVQNTVTTKTEDHF